MPRNVLLTLFVVAFPLAMATTITSRYEGDEVAVAHHTASVARYLRARIHVHISSVKASIKTSSFHFSRVGKKTSSSSITLGSTHTTTSVSSSGVSSSTTRVVVSSRLHTPVSSSHAHSSAEGSGSSNSSYSGSGSDSGSYYILEECNFTSGFNESSPEFVDIVNATDLANVTDLAELTNLTEYLNYSDCVNITYYTNQATTLRLNTAMLLLIALAMCLTAVGI